MIGKIIKDLPPTPENRRNSEGAFLTLKDGSILFVYSRFSNNWEDHAVSDLYAMVSEDNGETWCEPYLLLSHEQAGAENIMSVSLLRMENGDVGLFHGTKLRGVPKGHYMLRRSSDEGKTFGEPVPCGSDDGYFVTNNDRIVRCKNGRLLRATARHPYTYKTDENGVEQISGIQQYGQVWIYASDDDGYTWKTLAKDISIPRCRSFSSGLQEPGLLELEENRLWGYARTGAGRQYEFFSEDNGETWSEPLPSPFTSPLSPLSTKRLKDGRVVAVWNPIPIYNQRPENVDGVWTGARTPMVIALSGDNAHSFGAFKTVEHDEKGGFCYTATHETEDNALLLAYCAGAAGDVACLNRLRIRKIPLSEL